MNTSPVAASLPPCPVPDSRAGTRWPALAFAWCAETAPSVDFSAARDPARLSWISTTPARVRVRCAWRGPPGLSLAHRPCEVDGRCRCGARPGARTFASFCRATRRKAPIRLRGGTPPKCPYASCSVAHDPVSMRSIWTPIARVPLGGSSSRRTRRDLVSSCAPRLCIPEDPDGSSCRPRAISVAPAGSASRSPQAWAPVAGSPSCSRNRRARACEPRWPSSGRG